jgi:hypothetical protein
MKRTTGAEATALSIADRVSSESRRIWKGVRKGFAEKEGIDALATLGAVAPARRACRRKF